MPRRPTLTCKRCRERRVRCNKKRPCFSCVKNKTPQLCVYENNDELKFTKGNSTLHVFKVDDQNNKNKDLGFTQNNNKHEIDTNMNVNEPSNSNEDVIDFYEQFKVESCSQYINNGPLSWVFVEEIEPAMCKLKKYILSLNSINHEDEMSLQETEIKNNSSFNILVGDDTRFDSIVQKLQQNLPSRYIIWKSVSIFFKWIYPYMPFFDQQSFYKYLSRILDNNGKSSEISLNIIKKDDLAILGIVLLMIHLVHLMENYDDAKNFQNIVKKGSTAFELARLCYKHYQINEQLSIPVLQLSMTIRLYQKFAPEYVEGVCNIPSGIYISLLLQSAYSLGLNRDPINFPPRERNLRRKIWYYLLLLDINESFSKGTPLFSNTLYYNTIPCLPEEINEDSSNISDLDVEKAIVSFLQKSSVHLAPQLEILNMSLNLKGKPKLSTFLEQFNILESSFHSKMSIIDDIKIPIDINASVTEVYNKSHKLKLLLSSSTLFLSIYLHLMIYFEKRNNQREMLHYQLKIQRLTMEDMTNLLFSLTVNLKDTLGPSGILLVNSYFFQYIYQSVVVDISILYRLKYHLHNFETIYPKFKDKDNIYILLKEAIKNMKECISCSMVSIERLTGSYYTKLKIKKFLDLYLRVIDRQELYFINTSNSNLGKIRYTSDFLNQLNNIYISTLSNKPKVNPLGDITDANESIISNDLDFDFDFDFSKIDKALETLSNLNDRTSLIGNPEDISIDFNENFLSL